MLYAITAEHNGKQYRSDGELMNTNHECIIAGIPCIRINPKSLSNGIILLYHGWISKIQDYKFLGSMISEWGYTVIIPEIPYHGTRGKLNYFDPTVLQQYYWEVVTKAVGEASHIIDELDDKDKLVGVIGNSAGGFIAAGIFSTALGIRSAIVMNGSCAWVKFEELVCERDRREPWKSTNRELVEDLDPIRTIESLKNKSLLILHGAEDTTIPIDSQRYFIEMVEQNNVLKSVKFVEYSKVNHQITISMLEEVKNWLYELEVF